MKVTIFIPCYNNEKTLAKTLTSVIAQSYKDFSIVLIDNCSTDKSFEIASEFASKESRLKVLRNETNIGLEGNLTRCIELSDTEFTSIWHSDDIYETDLLKEQLAALIKEDKCSAVFTHGIEIDAHDQIIGKRPLPSEWKSKTSVQLNWRELFDVTLKFGNLINCPTLTARTQALKAVKRFDFNTFKTSADFEAWFRLAEQGPLLILTKPLFRYRISQASISVRQVKNRTERHDLFLVIDHEKKKAIQEKPLTKQQIEEYKFLEMKDLAQRSWNWLRLNSGEDPYSFSKVEWKILVKSLTKSAFHFKFGMACLVIFTLRLFK